MFRVTTFGESHGGGVGVVVDGCPAGLPLALEDIQVELDRRKPGQSRLVSQRKESDTVEFLSGLEDGVTLGTPIAMLVRNEDARPRDYSEMAEKHRPSHADFTTYEKFGLRPASGGGRASARETIGRVAAGAVAQKILKVAWGVEIVAWVDSVQEIQASVHFDIVDRASVEANDVRCPDSLAAEQMIERIESVRKDGNTVGGTIRALAKGVPIGWGDPVFDKLEADLAKAMLSLPACKGFESGSGFAGTLMTGREHNDPMRAEAGRVYTTQNHSGGIQGGITNGMPVEIRCAFKPVATVMNEQLTVTVDRENTELSGRGRHDACVLPRAVPMVEAMFALILVDHALRNETARLTFLNNRHSC